MDRVIRLWSCFEVDFSQLPTSNVGRSSVSVTGDCQVTTGRQNVLEFESFVQIPWNVLEFT